VGVIVPFDKDLFEYIRRIIELNWQDSGAHVEFIQIMHRALSEGERDLSDIESMKWALLPGLCCQAAGGNLHWADEIAAAWFLFSAAADIMDNVQDQDAPAPWWGATGPPAALSVATGFFFSASKILNQIYSIKEIQATASEVVEDFHKSFLHMSSGQYLDLIFSEPTLEQYWQIAEAKSGIFLSLACRSGARLATSDSGVVENYSQFGDHIGLLIQVLDDLNEFQISENAILLSGHPVVRRSLPVVYALDVYPPDKRQQLEKCLQRASIDVGAVNEAFELIENSGAVYYLMAEIEHHKSQALSILEEVALEPGSREILKEFVLSMAPLG